MHIAAFIIACIAAILFAIEASRTRWGFLPLGLLAFTVAYIITLTVEGGTRVLL